MHSALFGRRLSRGAVECRLCPHACRLDLGQTGRCRVRHNHGGELMTSAWGRPAVMLVEPIEKKYLFHVLPGCQTLSLGTAGCNFGCQYCINWQLSQSTVDRTQATISPSEVVQRALEAGAQAIAFTYTEPTIFFEYAEAIARLARPAGLRVVAKSNGFMMPAALERMATWVDALNVDLKGFHDDRHRRLIGGALAPVLACLRLARRLDVWLEVSTLLVPDLNDSDEDLRQMARFVSTELGEETPWHLLRFFPHYQMLHCSPTAQETLQRAADIAREEGLVHVYNQELARGRRLQTYCPDCQSLLIERAGLRFTASHLVAGNCPSCGRALAGVGLETLSTGASRENQSTASTNPTPGRPLRRPSAGFDDLGRL